MYMFVVSMQVHINKYKKENTWVVVHSVISYHFFLSLGGGLAVVTYQSGYVFAVVCPTGFLTIFFKFNSIHYFIKIGMDESQCMGLCMLYKPFKLTGCLVYTHLKRLCDVSITQ